MSYCGRYLGLYAGDWLGLVSSTSRCDALPPSSAPSRRYPHVQTIIEYPEREPQEPVEVQVAEAEEPIPVVAWQQRAGVNAALMLALLMDEDDYVNYN